MLENILGKDRILELYLNYAQWGDLVFGCEAAARCYFKKSCAHLALGEAARLAASLVSPERLSPLNAKSVFMQKRIEVIANNLFLKHIINDSVYIQVCGKSPPKDSLADSLTSIKIGGAKTKPFTASSFIARSPRATTATKRGHRF